MKGRSQSFLQRFKKKKDYKYGWNEFSLDDRGGQPASSVTISGAIHPDISTNKSNAGSTLLCAPAEALPIHMCSSKAEVEKKYSVKINLCLQLSMKVGQIPMLLLGFSCLA
jgi:hypothetical protein